MAASRAFSPFVRSGQRVLAHALLRIAVMPEEVTLCRTMLLQQMANGCTLIRAGARDLHRPGPVRYFRLHVRCSLGQAHSEGIYAQGDQALAHFGLLQDPRSLVVQSAHHLGRCSHWRDERRPALGREARVPSRTTAMA